MNKIVVKKVKSDDVENNAGKLEYTVTVHTDKEILPDDFFDENFESKNQLHMMPDRIVATKGAYEYISRHPVHKNNMRLAAILPGVLTQLEEALRELDK